MRFLESYGHYRHRQMLGAQVCDQLGFHAWADSLFIEGGKYCSRCGAPHPHNKLITRVEKEPGEGE